MKYLLTIITLVFAAIGANAQKLIAEKDWTGGFEGGYPMWAQFADGQEGNVTSVAEGVAITVGTQTGELWEPRVMVLNEGLTLEEDHTYKVVVTAKFPCNGTLQINMGNWDGRDQTTTAVTATGDFQKVEIVFENFAYYVDSNGFVLFQCGDFAGTTIVKKVQVYDMDAKGDGGKAVVASKDWTGGFEGGYPMWAQFADGQEGNVTSVAEGVAITVGTQTGELWEPRVMVLNEGLTLEEDHTYKVVVTAKFPCNGTLQINMGNWDGRDQTTTAVTATGDFQKVEIVFENFAYYVDSNGFVLFQCGDFAGTTIVKKVQVYDMDAKGDGGQGTGEDNVDKTCVTYGIVYSVRDDGSAEVTGSEDGFSNVDILSDVYIGGKTYQVTSISKDAFLRNSTVTSVSIPNSVTSIGESAFGGCSNLKSISIPNSVTELGPAAFWGCGALTEINLPSRLKQIKNNLLWACIRLKSVNIPDGVTIIEDEAFRECYALSSITIPDNVTEVGERAFEECPELMTITIGKGVSSIRSRAFADINGESASRTRAGNDRLQVFCKAETVPETASDAFDNSPIEQGQLYVPVKAGDSYRVTWPWSAFANILSLEGGDIPENPETPKCANPEVSYYNGKISFSCATDGVSYKYTITNDDVKSGSGNEVSLGVTYNLSVYATKTGYENSDRVTATLCWVDAEPKMEGIANDLSCVLEKAVLIQSNGNQLIISGVDAGTTINVFDLAGKSVGSAKVSSETTYINTTLRNGDIGIVKIGNKAVKVLMK